MNINVSRRQTIGGLAATALVTGIIAVGLSTSKTPNPLPAAATAAPKADDFSPYVTKDGGISLPLDYRHYFPVKSKLSPKAKKTTGIVV